MPSPPRTVTEVPGLELRSLYIDAADQDRLLAVVDASPWQTYFRRRVQHFGYRYDYRSRSVGRDAHLGPLPDWAADLANRLARETALTRVPDQLIVNEYLPGQGISPHVDCVPCFGDVVLSISLGSPCVITFTEPEANASVAVLVQPGDLLIMSGDARYVWRHSIAPRKSDLVEGLRVARGRRVSLTFRTVLADEHARR